MKTLAFVCNGSGDGKTTLVYHLAWMFAESGLSVLAVDLDPLANLSSLFLTEDKPGPIWREPERPERWRVAWRFCWRGRVTGQCPGSQRSLQVRILLVGDLALSALAE
jgi:chromosome partitioning protein